MPEFWNRPCASAGLKSYRYAGPYGFIMIGAEDDAAALRQAARSTVTPTRDRLERWDGATYAPLATVKP